MQVDDLILVSVDDHVVEPPDLFEGRLSARAAERAPYIEVQDNGREVWMFEGAALPNVGLNAVAGRVPEEYGLDPLAFSEMRPGCYDIHERIRDMNVNGVLGSMNFPSLAGFTGQLFSTCDDKDIAIELLRAYNDWHVEDWCGTYPGRMIPLSVPPIWDAGLMAAEVRRMADKGCHAVTFSENPEKLGRPSWHSDFWDPFLAACEDVGTVICLHIGSSSQVTITAMDAPIDTMITLQPMNIVQCVADLVWSPVFRKFPNLRVALSEGGIGWVPYFLERLDYVYQHHRAWTNQDFGDKLPSQVFNEHVLTCFIDDAVGMEVRHHLNPDHIHWECDYPHSDSTWPHAPEMAMKYLDGLPEEDIHRITHRNAIRNFQYDPFAHIPREEATVGALRAQAGDVDTTPVSHGTGKFQDSGIVTAMTLAERIAKMSAAPFRVQPALDDANRFFWTSGQDGRLRFLRCQACGYWLHPPLPRCPACGSREVAPETVSGRGEVWSYTVNHQPWDGGTEPYAIVLVALPEQDGLRLTSNLVNCPPDDVRIGLPVQVTFEQHDLVWFPLFEPA